MRVTDRAQYRAGRAVTGQKQVFLAEQASEWSVGEKGRLYREQGRSLQAELGWEEKGFGQRTARPGDPRVWNLGIQVGRSRAKLYTPLHFISLGSNELLL